MHPLIRPLVVATLFAATSIVGLADDLARLEGKWTTKKTSPEGQTYSQVIEIKKNKFTFRIYRGADTVAL